MAERRERGIKFILTVLLVINPFNVDQPKDTILSTLSKDGLNERMTITPKLLVLGVLF